MVKLTRQDSFEEYARKNNIENRYGADDNDYYTAKSAYEAGLKNSTESEKDTYIKTLEQKLIEASKIFDSSENMPEAVFFVRFRQFQSQNKGLLDKIKAGK